MLRADVRPAASFAPSAQIRQSRLKFQSVTNRIRREDGGFGSLSVSMATVEK